MIVCLGDQKFSVLFILTCKYLVILVAFCSTGLKQWSNYCQILLANLTITVYLVKYIETNFDQVKKSDCQAKWFVPNTVWTVYLF